MIATQQVNLKLHLSTPTLTWGGNHGMACKTNDTNVTRATFIDDKRLLLPPKATHY